MPRSRVHHPYFVVDQGTAGQIELMAPAVSASASSGALLVLPASAVGPACSAPEVRATLRGAAATLAVARPPALLIDAELRSGYPTLQYLDEEATRRLREALDGGAAVPTGDARPWLPAALRPTIDEGIAAWRDVLSPEEKERLQRELRDGLDALFCELLASERAAAWIRRALHGCGASDKISERLAASPSYAAHRLLAHAAFALRRLATGDSPPGDDEQAHALALSVVALDLVTSDGDARVLFQDLTKAADLRA